MHPIKSGVLYGLDFTFPFFGLPWENVVASENGYVYFDLQHENLKHETQYLAVAKANFTVNRYSWHKCWTDFWADRRRWSEVKYQTKIEGEPILRL